MRTFAKASLQENQNGKTVSEHDYDGHHSKANTPKHIPVVEVHFGWIVNLFLNYSCYLKELVSNSDL